MNRTQAMQADVLRDEIAQTRAELGETVQALAARADVRARARASARRTANRVRSARGTPGWWLALGAGAALVATLVVLARSRRG